MKEEILRIIQESPDEKFTSKELAEMMKITGTRASQFLISLVKSGEIETEGYSTNRSFFAIKKDTREVLKSRITPSFKPLVGYEASMRAKI